MWGMMKEQILFKAKETKIATVAPVPNLMALCNFALSLDAYKERFNGFFKRSLGKAFKTSGLKNDGIVDSKTNPQFYYTNLINFTVPMTMMDRRVGVTKSASRIRIVSSAHPILEERDNGITSKYSPLIINFPVGSVTAPKCLP
uniref:Uncharacterized protein n=1 Tax=Lactuca sativa TaxID=4236 RepID=A0A9R1UUK7_LACSA|nr:hypothetical protein LSAT_V11C800403370 [Lactuca sativa]